MWVPVLKIHQWFLYRTFFLYICFLGQYNYNKIHGCGQMNKQCVFESEFIVRILVWSMLIQCLFLIDSLFETQHESRQSLSSLSTKYSWWVFKILCLSICLVLSLQSSPLSNSLSPLNFVKRNNIFVITSDTFAMCTKILLQLSKMLS